MIAFMVGLVVRGGLLAVVLAFSWAAQARAETIVTYRFEGAVYETSAAFVKEGDRFMGAFTYDIDAIDEYPDDPEYGYYHFPLPADQPLGISWTLGSLAFRAEDFARIITFNVVGFKHSFTFEGFTSGAPQGVPMNGQVHLEDETGISFATDHIPATLNLADFSIREFSAYLSPDPRDPRHREYFLGEIDTLVIVPEPASAPLFAVGVLASIVLMWLRRRSAFAVGCSALLFAVPAAAAEYTYKNIADSTGPFSSFGSVFASGAPSINDAGTVAFGAELDAGGAGIFTGSGGPTTIIAVSPSAFGGPDFRPSINNAGTVAFLGYGAGVGSGIFTGSGGPTTTIALYGDRFWSISIPSINDAGTVVFAAQQNGIVDSGVFTGSGGPLTTIADSSGPLSRLGQGDPSINAAGNVTFLAYLDDLGSPGIFIGSGGPITTIAIGSATRGLAGAPSINDAGTVAFLEGRSYVDPGNIYLLSQAISTSSDGPITTIADSSGPFDFPGFGEPCINDAGTVAFLAPLDAGGKGIFTGGDPDADKVIATGDPLFGSTVANLNFFRGLNDRGDIAFRYELDNHVTGIAVAVVPEPSTLALWSINCGALMLIAARRRQLRNWLDIHK